MLTGGDAAGAGFLIACEMGASPGCHFQLKVVSLGKNPYPNEIKTLAAGVEIIWLF